MNETDRRGQVALAMSIAEEAHRGQVDKLGCEYIKHPAAVAAQFDPLAETVEHCAAWLHDVIEDTPIDADELRSRGVRDDVIEVVELLTRRRDDGDAYYERIAAHPAARAVKLADIRHNTDPARVAQLDDATRERLADKYRHALEVLDLRGRF